MFALEYQALFMFITNFVSNKIIFLNTLLFIVGFSFAFLSVPIIAEIARSKNLLAQPNDRSSHTSPIPAFGGISIFIGFLFMFLLLVPDISPKIAIISLSASAIFLLGLLDDIFDIRAIIKLSVFILIALLISTTKGLAINELHGFLSIHHLNAFISIPFTVLVIVAVVNAINLIDGIDGLASGLGIVILGVFSVVFYRSGHINYLYLTVPVILSLIAFVGFNIWGKRFKMFLGDSGALLLGFVISISLIHFMGLKDSEVNTIPVRISLVSVFALLIIPIFDTVHVFIKRIKVGRSPFSPGKEHIHHTYLKFGLSHASITLILMLYTVLFFVLAQVLLFYLSGIVALGIILTMAFFMWNFIEYKVEKQHIAIPASCKRIKYLIPKEILIRPRIIRMADCSITGTKGRIASIQQSHRIFN